LAAWREAVAGTNLPQPPDYQGRDVALVRLVEHTDEVAPGAAFVARVRNTSDGHRYIGQAASRGASLVVGQRPREALDASLPPDLPYLQVDDTAVATAWLAAAWENFPARQLVVAGITGTDGKSTTANFLFQILRSAGIRAGLLSTVRAMVGEREEPLALHVTTPEAPVVQRFLCRMVGAGLTHCVLEATSHGLAQHRVGAVDFDVATITNITHEHLDYHGSFEAYVTAKELLFKALLADRPTVLTQNADKHRFVRAAVLNADDASWQRLGAIPAPRQVTYGLEAPADVFARDLTFAPQETRFQLHLPGDQVTVSSRYVGRFNVYNMLAAAATAYALGLSAPAIAAGLSQMPVLPGRMERIDEGQPFLVVVDFAHTPNALRRALEAARSMVSGRVVVVFGSAGRRDVAKRTLMAEIAARDADLAVLTAEDPRTESLAQILETMAEGCRSQGGREGQTFWRIPDRGRAIYYALSLVEEEDVVLVCGKGHEQSMCFGTTEFPWDDRQATRAALRAYLRGEAAPDLGLPTYTS
jgi:UDP-N-acetylmuramoyl-L-alanyl-D-glutamate--2,6-diaminopimelate ligase